MTNTGELLLFL